MVKPQDLVVWLDEVDKDDSHLVGGKAANLGEMIQAKFPVPGGFVITSFAYFAFLKENKLDLKIKHLLGTVHYDRPESLNQVSTHIRKIIQTAKVPEKIVKPIFTYYEKMGRSPLVAIRSSATAEDSKTASFAGQQETFLNIRGEAALIEKVREAWASLFKPRAIFYRHERKLDSAKAGIALAVQKMVESEASGVMFTVDPVTQDKSKIIIEAIYGLGEYVVQGRVTPDHYEVGKGTFAIFKKDISVQNIMLKKVGVDNKEVKVPMLARKRQKIKDQEIIEFAKLGLALERHYYFPQDVEWAKEKGKLYIVQTRPITTLHPAERGSGQAQEQGAYTTKVGHPILIGDPASPGIGIGQVKILLTPKEIGKVKSGDVLVAPFTSPDYVPAMKKASAIVTERGGRTSHAAIVSREFGIPAVVGVPQATRKLHDNEVVTINGKTGEIFKGSIHINQSQRFAAVPTKTQTKLYVNLSEPELAKNIAQRNVDGVGLLRAEFMIAQIGIHPKKLIKEHREKLFIDQLVQGLETICQAFYPRPVLYRTTDFKTNEYRNLTGGREFEPIEPNPMLGFRGAYRYVADPKVFKLELEAVRLVRTKKELNNLHVMIPFVRTPQELAQVKKLIVSHDLRRSPTFKLFMMVEIPSNVILIEDFINVGIDGISIGSNDLTMLLLGTDRDNEEVARVFDERNTAVLWALERVVKTGKKHGVLTSICGQAPSLYPELVEKLVEWGISSISVSPDALEQTRATINLVETKLKNHG